LLAVLADDGTLYRVAFRVAGPDPRLALRARSEFDQAERDELAARLARGYRLSPRGRAYLGE
jgi:hypothetical protein